MAKWHFSTSAQILESVYVPEHTSLGMSKVNINTIDLQNFALVRKNNDFDEFKVHLIQR